MLIRTNWHQRTQQRNVRKVIFRHWHNGKWLFFFRRRIRTFTRCLLWYLLTVWFIKVFCLKLWVSQLIDNCFCGEQRKKSQEISCLSDVWILEEKTRRKITTSFDRFHNNLNSITFPQLTFFLKTKLNLLYTFFRFHS